MFNSIVIPKQYQMGGVIIWGKSSDLDSKNECEQFYYYLKTTLGPALYENLLNKNYYNETLIK